MEMEETFIYIKRVPQNENFTSVAQQRKRRSNNAVDLQRYVAEVASLKSKDDRPIKIYMYL